MAIDDAHDALELRGHPVVGLRQERAELGAERELITLERTRRAHLLLKHARQKRPINLPLGRLLLDVVVLLVLVLRGELGLFFAQQRADKTLLLLLLAPQRVVRLLHV